MQASMQGRFKRKGPTRMSVIRNIPIARKFMFAFGLVCALCIGLSSYSLIIESSKQVEHQIQLIATAATEQTASGEISESAGHISQLATENSHGAEEAAKALKNLASLANDLEVMIHQFQLEKGRSSASSSRGQYRPAVHGVAHPAAA